MELIVYAVNECCNDNQQGLLNKTYSRLYNYVGGM